MKNLLTISVICCVNLCFAQSEDTLIEDTPRSWYNQGSLHQTLDVYYGYQVFDLKPTNLDLQNQHLPSFRPQIYAQGGSWKWSMNISREWQGDCDINFMKFDHQLRDLKDSTSLFLTGYSFKIQHGHDYLPNSEFLDLLLLHGPTWGNLKIKRTGGTENAKDQARNPIFGYSGVAALRVNWCFPSGFGLSVGAMAGANLDISRRKWIEKSDYFNFLSNQNQNNYYLGLSIGILYNNYNLMSTLPEVEVE